MFSEDSRFVAVLFGSKLDYEAELYSSESGNLVWSQSFTAKGRILPSPYLATTGGFLTILSPNEPGASYFAEGGLCEKTETFVFEFDKNSGAFVSASKFEGVLFAEPTPGKNTTYHCTQSDRNVIVVKEWSE